MTNEEILHKWALHNWEWDSDNVSQFIDCDECVECDADSLLMLIESAKEIGAREQREKDTECINIIIEQRCLSPNHEEDNYDAGQLHAFVDAIAAIRENKE